MVMAWKMLSIDILELKNDRSFSIWYPSIALVPLRLQDISD